MRDPSTSKLYLPTECASNVVDNFCRVAELSQLCVGIT